MVAETEMRGNGKREKSKKESQVLMKNKKKAWGNGMRGKRRT